MHTDFNAVAFSTADALTTPSDDGSANVLSRTHVFSPRLARDKECKHKGAILLGYLANRIHALGNEREGRLWFFVTIENLSERCPYLPPSTIGDTLDRLCDAGILLRARFNRRSGDKTWWYAFANDDVFQEALNPTKPIHFRVRDAVERKDIVQAVIMANMRKHFETNTSEIRISANALSKIIPFSKAQILSALECLINDDVVAQVAAGGRDRAFSLIKGRNWPAENQKPAGSFSEMGGENSEMDGVVSEMGGEKSDDVTYCNLNCNNLLKEESFTLGPASPSLASNSSLRPLLEAGVVSTHAGDQIINGSTASFQGLTYSKSSTVVASPIRWNLSVSSFRDLKEMNEKQEAHINSDSCQLVALETARCFLLSLSVPEVLLLHRMETEEQLMSWLLPRVQSSQFALLGQRLERANSDMREQLAVLVLRAALEWMIRGFMGYRDQRYLTGKCGYRMVVEICGLLEPIKEQLLKERIQEQLKERKARFRSPDHKKENDPTLSPYDKARVFNNSLIERQAVGWFTRSGTLQTDVIEFHGGCVKLANELFTRNPDLTVAHLNQVLDRCVDTSINDSVKESPDPLFFTRKGTSIFSFLKNLDKILAELQLHGQLPIVEFLDPMQFVKEEASKPSQDP